MKEQEAKRLSEADAQLLRTWFIEEAGLQEELSGMLSDMENHLVSHNVRSLENHLVTSSSVLGRLEILDKKRSKILSHLVRAANLRAKKGVLAHLVDLAPANRRKELETLLAALEDSGSSVRARSNRNGLLARKAIDINDELVRGLFAVDAKTATYDRRGGTTRHSEMILNRSI